MKTLEDYIREESIRAAAEFKEKGRVPSRFMGEFENNRKVVMDHNLFDRLGIDFGNEDHKERIGHIVKLIFRTLNIQTYLYTCEVWVAQETEPEEIDRIVKGKSPRVPPRDNPNRYEVVFYIAERPGEQVMGQQAIIRPAGQEPYLSDEIEFTREGKFSGRFAGVFEFKPTEEEKARMSAYVKIIFGEKGIPT